MLQLHLLSKNSGKIKLVITDKSAFGRLFQVSLFRLMRHTMPQAKITVHASSINICKGSDDFIHRDFSGKCHSCKNKIWAPSSIERISCAWTIFDVIMVKTKVVNVALANRATSGYVILGVKQGRQQRLFFQVYSY